MNVIDLFKALDFYNNKNPSLKAFYLAFKNQESEFKPPYAYFVAGHGSFVGYWFHEIKDQQANQSGIFFIYDLDGRMHMDAEEKKRRIANDYYFNNYWPKRGGDGEIDLEATIRLNLIAPTITS